MLIFRDHSSKSFERETIDSKPKPYIGSHSVGNETNVAAVKLLMITELNAARMERAKLYDRLALVPDSKGATRRNRTHLSLNTVHFSQRQISRSTNM